jgi:hypothetical protein
VSQTALSRSLALERPAATPLDEVNISAGFFPNIVEWEFVPPNPMVNGIH